MSFYIPGQKTQNQTEEPGKDQKQPESEYLTVSSKSKSTRNSTIMLAAVFIIGAIGLFVGIKKTSVNAAQAANPDSEDLQLELAVATITGIKVKMTNQMDQIVKKFYEFSNVKQVGVNELAKNPFTHGSSLGQLVTPQAQPAGTFAQQQLKQAVSTMQLLSVMLSDDSPEKSCCMINDKILYLGQSINGFEISRIKETGVTLKADELEIELKLPK